MSDSQSIDLAPAAGAPSHRPVDEPPWVIVGCGYTGERLARRLVRAGARVTITRREADAAAAAAARLGEVAHAGVSLTEGEALRALLPVDAIVVVSAPPARDGGTAGEEALVAACAASRVRRIVYISSTGVYPPGGGDWIDEDTAVAPASERGARRLAAETAVLDGARRAGIEAVSLRASGIYGPERGVEARMRAGTYRIIGAGDTYVNRIHVDDLAAIAIAAGTVRALPRPVYNVADDEPCTALEHARGVAEALGLPMPPMVDPASVDPSIVAMLSADRRIDNRRVKRELGVTLRYPSWRAALPEQ